MYISDKCEWTPYGYDFSLDEKLDSCLDNEDKIKDFLQRNKNYGLDMVFNYTQSHNKSMTTYLKLYIARQGYGLDILVNDRDYIVRAAVAEQGYGLDKLVNDKDWPVREAVAKQGYGLDVLVNDEHWPVRVAVARHGYGLDKLINDASYEVRDATKINSLVKWYNENPDKRYYDSLRQIFDDQQCSTECADLLINDNYFLDYILKNADAESRSKVKRRLIELGCNNIEDWKIHYPNNAYYSI